jgi:predicted nucleic acid-binding protein
MVFLDSDVLINFLRKDSKTVQLMNKLRTEKNDIFITPINSFELLNGIPKDSKMDKSKVIEFLKNFSIKNFDYDSSIKAAEIFEDLKNSGGTVDLADVLIASIIITNNETLITNNISHFERISRLKLKKLV